MNRCGVYAMLFSNQCIKRSSRFRQPSSNIQKTLKNVKCSFLIHGVSPVPCFVSAFDVRRLPDEKLPLHDLPKWTLERGINAPEPKSTSVARLVESHTDTYLIFGMNDGHQEYRRGRSYGLGGLRAGRVGGMSRVRLPDRMWKSGCCD